MRDQPNAGATSETTGTWKTIHIIHAPSHSNKVNMKRWLWRPNDIRELVGQLPDICLTGEEKPRKNSPRKLVPTGDRTRARCVTGAHATGCSTAVDWVDTLNSLISYLEKYLFCVCHWHYELLLVTMPTIKEIGMPLRSLVLLDKVCKHWTIPITSNRKRSILRPKYMYFII